MPGIYTLNKITVKYLFLVFKGKRKMGQINFAKMQVISGDCFDFGGAKKTFIFIFILWDSLKSYA